jgi:hypothetical protein
MSLARTRSASRGRQASFGAGAGATAAAASASLHNNDTGYDSDTATAILDEDLSLSSSGRPLRKSSGSSAPSPKRRRLEDESSQRERINQGDDGYIPVELLPRAPLPAAALGSPRKLLHSRLPVRNSTAAAAAAASDRRSRSRSPMRAAAAAAASRVQQQQQSPRRPHAAPASASASAAESAGQVKIESVAVDPEQHPGPNHETSRDLLLAKSFDDALRRFEQGQEVVILPLPPAEARRLREAIASTDFFAWINERLFDDDHQLPIERIQMKHIMGDAPWPFKKSAPLKLPNYGSGMHNMYWSPVHKVAAELPTLVQFFDRRMGTNRWVLDSNRFRLAQPGTGGVESVHTDHNGMNPQRIGRPASIVSLSNQRTFSWFRGTASPEILTELKETYAHTLSADKHYVTYPLDKSDPMQLLKRRTKVRMNAFDVLLFNDNLIHEVAANDTDRLNLSIFLSPRDVDRQPQPAGKPLAKYTPHQLVQTSAIHYYTPHIPTTLSEAQSISWLLGIQPPMWASGKLTFMVHQQAFNTYSKSFQASAKYKGATPFEPLPPQEVSVEDIREEIVRQYLIIPQAAMQKTHWHRDPTRLSRALQFRLGFRKNL